MQITEQIIERIARRTFNSMFAPALRQSNVVMGGSGSSVSWADNAGHATTADSATTAGSAATAASASAAPWAGITDKPATATRWPKWSEVTEKPNFATVATSGSYSDLSDKPYIPSVSASVANSTLTVTIDGTSYSLTDTNTWRPVVNNLSSTDTDKSLSAAMGKDLYGYITTLQGYFDANGNAKSALKLTTVSKTAWGQTFWTSGGVPDSIDGNMSNVGNISFSASGKNIGEVLYFDTTNNRLGINQSSPSYALDVSGGLLAITNNSRTVTIGAQNTSGIHIYNDNSSPFFFNGDVSSNASKTYDLGSSTYPWGTLYAAGGAFYDTSPSVHVGTSSSARISLHWSSDSNRGIYDYSGYWVVATNGTNTFMMKGNVGIGTTSPSYKLHVSGQIFSTGGFTFNSDERKKNIIDHDVKLSVADIANAPLIHYTLKDDPLRRVCVGSIAQYWQKVLPETVSTDKEGYLSMSYDVQAHAAVVVLARKVQQLEKIINELQSRKA